MKVIGANAAAVLAVLLTLTACGAKDDTPTGSKAASSKSSAASTPSTSTAPSTTSATPSDPPSETATVQVTVEPEAPDVPAADVERKLNNELGSEGEYVQVSCPEALKGKVGATLQCNGTDSNDSGYVLFTGTLTVTVTAIEGAHVEFSSYWN